jgi:tetratricopeptide (TPR) repeat protein
VLVVKGAPGIIRAVSLLWVIAAICPVGALAGASADATPFTPAGEEQWKEKFVKGNALYEEGDYQGAVDEYVDLVNSGTVDENLYYNLANSYYRIDELGEAVLFYERALRLVPRDTDVRENLALVRSQLRDKQFVREQNRVVGAIVWLHNHLSTQEMILLASCCYVVLCLLGIVFVFRRSRIVSAVYQRMSIVSLGRLAGLNKTQDILLVGAIVACLFVSTGFSAYLKVGTQLRREVGVVLEREVPVYGSPTPDSTLQFKIHEGTMVTIHEQRLRRVRIRLPGGLSGWVSIESVGWV